MSETLDYINIVSEFSKLNKTDLYLPTFMEISRYPHFENVCSNILGFYFDTHQSHNFSDLFVKSLTDCTSDNEWGKFDLQVIDCIREFSTDQLKRIDLVIEGNDWVIVIENKIFHTLNNDLEHYEKTIKKIYPKNKYLFIVLSIKKEDTSGSFINVTYETFFNKLKPLIGQYAIKANSLYLTYLFDFIKTIENHYIVEEINKEMFQFIVKNEETINALNNEKNNIQNRLISTVNKLIQLIEYNNPFCFQKWIWNKTTLVFDFKFDSKTVALDITINKTNVVSEIFVRDHVKDYELLDKLHLIKYKTMNYKKNHRGYDLFEESINFFDIQTDELLTKIKNIIEQIKI